MKRVSELITTDEIRRWSSNDIITITAGTGVGKSYFIKNILYAFAKKENKRILFLIHRSNCVNQFQKEIEADKKTDFIDIKTYQSLESLYINNNKPFDFANYQYIVCDEFHYFMSDASFNKTTDISLNLILSQKNKIKIFMSATGDYIKRYINNIKKIKTINYEMPINYNFIKNLTFFNKDKTLEMLIQEAIDNGDKGIFFIDSAKKAYELYKKYKKNCLFNCSASNSQYYKYVDTEKVNNMLAEEKFNEQILITTTCMDAGVNIIDTDVKHIVCDVIDTGVLIQCIGRKRLQNDNDKINVYIKTLTNQKLGGIETQLKRKIKMAEFFSTHTVKEYIEEYKRSHDKSNMVYDDTVTENDKCTKKMNELMYFKCKLDIKDISLIKKYKEYGYCKFVAEKLGFVDDKGFYSYRLIEEDHKRDALEEYLDSIIGKRLYKEEQKELKEIFKKNGLNARTLGINTLNGNLKDRKLPYTIEIPERKSYRDRNGKIKKEQSYWVVGKIIFS